MPTVGVLAQYSGPFLLTLFSAFPGLYPFSPISSKREWKREGGKQRIKWKAFCNCWTAKKNPNMAVSSHSLHTQSSSSGQLKAAKKCWAHCLASLCVCERDVHNFRNSQPRNSLYSPSFPSKLHLNLSLVSFYLTFLFSSITCAVPFLQTPSNWLSSL